VLHATADLAQTLRHVRGLLAPGGLLLCLEAVAAERWSDLTFGMTEGWWRFTDLVLRPAHALLSADSWRSLLEDTGWTQIYSIGGEPGTMVGRAQQALVIARAPTLARRFTLVGDGDGLAETLAARLRARGDVVSVRDIDDEDADFHGGDLVYLGALQLGAHTSADECAEFACAAAIRWLARFGREPASALPGRAWLVTAGAQAVQGRVTSSGRFQAPLWGVGRVFALEQPGRWGGLVDLSPKAAAGAQLDELLCLIDGFGEEDQFAWRDGRPFGARLQRSRGPARRSIALNPDATYMVVGGFGGLGLLIGRWLAEQGARHIALLGRTPDMSSAGVAAIRAAGAAVIPLAVDVADVPGLRALLKELARDAPPLRGIVHAATAVSVVPIAELTAFQVAAMLRPKVAGLLALEQVAPDLDFMVLFSSTAALTGAMGMAHYAAANAFLDASAQQSDGPMLAVNWGRWDVVRAASEAQLAALREGGLNALNATHALDAMGLMVATGVRQMAMADIDWSRFKPLFERSRPRPFLASFSALAGDDGQRSAAQGRQTVHAAVPGVVRDASAPTMLVDLISPLPTEDRMDFLERWVREAVASTLGSVELESVPPGAGLFDLGIDSLMALSLQRKLEQSLGCPLPATLTFNYPNARALAGYLAKILGETGFAPASGATPNLASRDAEIDAMTDAEVEEQLRARLEDVR
jgi:NAD(P)-dependent dehydrogenase (short-subunit alcohol dehydrogenase family)/acyl carrier protein